MDIYGGFVEMTCKDLKERILNSKEYQAKIAESTMYSEMRTMRDEIESWFQDLPEGIYELTGKWKRIGNKYELQIGFDNYYLHCWNHAQLKWFIDHKEQTCKSCRYVGEY